MPNQYTVLNRENILRKVNRRSKPINSAADLAREFGVNVEYTRRDPNRPATDTAVPASFRNKVIALVGPQVWNQIRQDQFVNLRYR